MLEPAPPRAAWMLNKVPKVALAFWVIKIMSTTVGGTGADYLAVHVGLGTAIQDAGRTFRIRWKAGRMRLMPPNATLTAPCPWPSLATNAGSSADEPASR